MASRRDQTLNAFAVSQTRPQSALRLGEYKLVHSYETGRDEFYRLSDDFSEQRDLSADEPQKSRELRHAPDAYLREAGKGEE